MRSDRDSAAFPLTRLLSCSLLQYCPSPPLFFSSPAGRFFARVAKMPGPFVPGSLTDHGLLLPLRLRLLRSCVFCFCGFLTGTMWDSRWGLVTAADYWCIHHQWRGIPAPEIECHVTCGALFFLTTCSLLLSNDIISELKSLLHDYDDALAGPEKPACRTGLAWPGWGVWWACDRSCKDFDREGRGKSEIKPSISDALAARGKSFPARC